jgi:hypothetical protein
VTRLSPVLDQRTMLIDLVKQRRPGSATVYPINGEATHGFGDAKVIGR